MVKNHPRTVVPKGGSDSVILLINETHRDIFKRNIGTKFGKNQTKNATRRDYTHIELLKNAGSRIPVQNEFRGQDRCSFHGYHADGLNVSFSKANSIKSVTKLYLMQ